MRNDLISVEYLIELLLAIPGVVLVVGGVLLVVLGVEVEIVPGS